MTRIVTWNLRGSAGPDLDAVARFLEGIDADVIAVQEIQRRQAEALAGRLGWNGAGWSFKHWPVIYGAEGMTVLARSPCHLRRVFAVRARWRFWTWKRRIVQVVDVQVVDVHVAAPAAPAAQPPRAGQPPATPTATAPALALANVHLSPHADGPRGPEIDAVIAALPTTAAVVAGDINAKAGSAELEAFAAAGFRPPANGVPPWLDHVLVRPPLRAALVAAEGAPTVSDHRPVVVDVHLDEAPDQG